ncbi:hypothetical protein PACTADRAFT_51645 [Pachysolen tannophilus NRRL Y-2460]|uniref:BZIP domain-containing protein n=1 Tax=Pachysolen tannophilus NRRL Y-2460 TaxID=669874 RepID=A0A1E4TQ75_PACTA|nr:hypothetical protein PACTADRAFT_51645 [Pachysolen tannophilus NRRL Y-2460]
MPTILNSGNLQSLQESHQNPSEQFLSSESIFWDNYNDGGCDTSGVRNNFNVSSETGNINGGNNSSNTTGIINDGTSLNALVNVQGPEASHLIEECFKKETESLLAQDNNNNNNNRSNSISKSSSDDGISDSSLNRNHKDGALQFSSTSQSEAELYLKRKAQNRAAQRAFRERKETKLKELSTKLNKTEAENEKLSRELEELKQKIIMLDTENQLLTKNYSIVASDSNSGKFSFKSEKPNTSTVFSFPLDKEKFINNLIKDTEHDISKAFQNDNLVYQETGDTNGNSCGKILTVGAVWDYLYNFSMEHEELELDITNIMDQLKGNEKCHGYGPGYSLKLLNEIIAEAISKH